MAPKKRNNAKKAPDEAILSATSPPTTSGDDDSNRISETMLLEEILSDSQPDNSLNDQDTEYRKRCISTDSYNAQNNVDCQLDVQSFVSDPVLVSLNFQDAKISEPRTISSIPSASVGMPENLTADNSDTQSDEELSSEVDSCSQKTSGYSRSARTTQRTISALPLLCPEPDDASSPRTFSHHSPLQSVSLSSPTTPLFSAGQNSQRGSASPTHIASQPSSTPSRITSPTSSLLLNSSGHSAPSTSTDDVVSPLSISSKHQVDSSTITDSASGSLTPASNTPESLDTLAPLQTSQSLHHNVDREFEAKQMSDLETVNSPSSPSALGLVCEQSDHETSDHGEEEDEFDPDSCKGSDHGSGSGNSTPSSKVAPELPVRPASRPASRSTSPESRRSKKPKAVHSATGLVHYDSKLSGSGSASVTTSEHVENESSLPTSPGLVAPPIPERRHSHARGKSFDSSHSEGLSSSVSVTGSASEAPSTVSTALATAALSSVGAPSTPLVVDVNTDGDAKSRQNSVAAAQHPHPAKKPRSPPTNPPPSHLRAPSCSQSITQTFQPQPQVLPQRFCSPISDFLLSCAENFFSVEGTIRRRKSIFNVWKNPQFFSISLILVPAPPSDIAREGQAHSHSHSHTSSTSPTGSRGRVLSDVLGDNDEPRPSGSVNGNGIEFSISAQQSVSPTNSPPIIPSSGTGLVPRIKVDASIRVFNKKPSNRADWANPDETYYFSDRQFASAVGHVGLEYGLSAFTLRLKEKSILLGCSSPMEAECWHAAFQHIYSCLETVSRNEHPMLMSLPPGKYITNLRALTPEEPLPTPSNPRDRDRANSTPMYPRNQTSDSNVGNTNASSWATIASVSGDANVNSSTTTPVSVPMNTGSVSANTNNHGATVASSNGPTMGQGQGPVHAPAPAPSMSAPSASPIDFQAIGNTFSSFFRKVIPSTTNAPSASPAGNSTPLVNSSQSSLAIASNKELRNLKSPETPSSLSAQPEWVADKAKGKGKGKGAKKQDTVSLSPTSSSPQPGVDEEKNEKNTTDVDIAATAGTNDNDGDGDGDGDANATTTVIAHQGDAETDSWSALLPLRPTRYQYGKDDKERMNVPSFDTLTITWAPMTTKTLPFNCATAYMLLFSDTSPGSLAHFHKYRGDSPSTMTISRWHLQQNKTDAPQATTISDVLPVNAASDPWKSFLARDFQVTIPVSGAPGISSSRLNKVQRIAGTSDVDGGKLTGLLLECISNTPDVTFGSNFAIIERWVLQDLPGGETASIDMKSAIYYASKPFTMRAFSGMIESRGKSDTQGICEDFVKFAVTELPKSHPDALQWANRMVQEHAASGTFPVAPRLPRPAEVGAGVGSAAAAAGSTSSTAGSLTTSTSASTASVITPGETNRNLSTTLSQSDSIFADEGAEGESIDEILSAPSFLDRPSVGAVITWSQTTGTRRLVVITAAIFVLWLIKSIASRLFSSLPSLSVPIQVVVLLYITLEISANNTRQSASLRLQARTIQRLEKKVASLNSNLNTISQKLSDQDKPTKFIPSWIETEP